MLMSFSAGGCSGVFAGAGVAFCCPSWAADMGFNEAATVLRSSAMLFKTYST